MKTDGYRREKRRARSLKETHELLDEIWHDGQYYTWIDGIIQCGLGDWAEGPALLDKYPPTDIRYLAVDPIHRYAFETWAAGFRGSIIQGCLWSETGRIFKLQDFRSKTSILDTEKRRGEFKAHSLTLDDAVTYTNYSAKSILLWMDVEGAEFEILKGAKNTLENVSVIVCEVKDKPRIPGWKSTSEVVVELNEYGFSMIKRVADNGLFVRSSRVEK